ncbi:WD repeat-containing protein 11 [Selaginella moellendorffii]|uniref:WD repeat-containing protein 11 n=1 Tax=Selaginella moellendorffii TaxID=88036 RepID=UPI000D1C29B5|nr:WD repeat-containing protein 11 [Selaginella moellendorffii]XP_024526781.1 WD repeat-containing protein 11 [Selaginella moellendorffii]|eukprot:XP_024526780.1 WD repeat-containing protein 11 [Selaginella moellendorffii]
MAMAMVMPGPASRENAGCADCSAHGLLAYGAGSAIVLVDVRSMQLLLVLPMPAPRPSLPASYVSALQWLPQGLPHSAMEDLSAPQKLQLAAGDRQGRIAIWDVSSGLVATWLGDDKNTGSSSGGVYNLCWIHSHPSWLLAAIHGANLLVIWDPRSRSAIWRYDAADTLTCLRCDPLDSRQLCALGVKGLLLSILVTGTENNSVLSKSYQLEARSIGDHDERDRSSSSASSASGTGGTPSSGGGGASNSTTAAALPSMVMGTSARCHFSSSFGASRGILYVVLPREIVVFDLHLGMTLSSMPLPRGCAKFLDLVADVGGELLFFAHVDGKLSSWKRKENSQVFSIVQIDSLMPSFGTPVPPPSVLAVTFCPIGMPHGVELEPPKQQAHITFVSVSDDGRLWEWRMKHDSLHQLSENSNVEFAFQLELTGQLHLLPSSVITLAVAVPSLLATMSGGGNAAAPSVPLAALATQSGTLELHDPSAHAITSSFSVHNNNAVRGIRWLGNTRLVSFSYTEVKGKGGGFINRLVLTCIRSGQSRCFRVLQKPERAPMRALRTSPSGRYMLILFREAPAEVWAMTKNPQMLRSLALPFTVMEWALPPAPKPSDPPQLPSHRPSLAYRERPTIASTVAAANASPAGDDQADASQQDETAESFAFALVNGSLGVFELRGRRVRDFKPKWPVSSFVLTDVLVTAMAYRMPHVVMGDRVGNLRWWDVTSGSSSSFNTHRGGIRRIKFAPVSANDSTRGRVAVLFNDNTFAVYDLDTQDPVANSLVQPQLAGMLVLELDWYPLRIEKQDPLQLCLVGADGSFRMLEIQTTKGRGSRSMVASWEKSRPMPVYSPALLPYPQASALRILLQTGVSASWFGTSPVDRSKSLVEFSGDLRQFLLETNLPAMGDSVVLEILLKALEPFRRTGRLLDAQSIRNYTALSKQGCASRLAFAAAHFGNYLEALFWLQLPRALALLVDGPTEPAPTLKESLSSFREQGSAKLSNDNENSRKEQTWSTKKMAAFACDRATVRAVSEERISWHKTLGGDEAAQKLVHEYVSAGDFEAAVTLLLATPPENPHFYVDALRAVTLAAAVSPGLHELAIKVVAANMVATDDSLGGTHLLCAVGRYQEACSQLQDAGRWEDACTLAASKLSGPELSRVLERWAEHVLQTEHNIWKASTLFVAAGALSEALRALNAQCPDVAALFLLACHEAKAGVGSKLDSLDLPGDLAQHMEDVNAVCEFYAHHQRRLSQQCSGLNFY